MGGCPITNVGHDEERGMGRRAKGRGMLEDYRRA